MENVRFTINKVKRKTGHVYRLRMYYNDFSKQVVKHIGYYETKKEAISERDKLAKIYVKDGGIVTDDIELETFISDLIERWNVINSWGKQQYYQHNLSFNDFKEYCSKNNIKHLNKVTPVNLERFAAWVKKNRGSKNRSYNLRIGFIKRIFTYAYETDVLPTNPSKNLKKLKETDRQKTVPIKREHLKMLLDKTYSDYRWLYNLLIGYIYTGCRRKELTELKWKDIDFERNIIILAPEKTKGKYGRVVPLHPEFVKVLDSIERLSKYVFTYPDGTKVTPDNVTHRFSYVRRKLGLPEKYKIHGLRSTFITNALKSGDITAVMDIVGHRDLTTTTRYIKSDDESRRETINKLEYNLED